MIVYLLLSFWSCYLFSAEDALHMPCETRSDCKFTDALICHSDTKTCELPRQVDERGCGEDADCVSGAMCERIASSEGVCRDVFGHGEGPCTVDDCDVDLTCTPTTDGAVCLGAEGASCIDDPDFCAEPLRCAYATLNAPATCTQPREAGGECGDKDACLTDRCEGGVCVANEGETCDNTAPYCATGLVCRPDAAGTDRCFEPATIFDACVEDADCGAQSECDEGLCRASFSAACNGSDATCASPWVCRPNEVGFSVCSNLGSPGESCDTLKDCASEDCSLATGTCPGDQGSLCQTEDDCLGDLRCAKGFEETRTCQPQVEGCGACDASEDCESGRCTGGFCLQEISGSCSTSACCPDGSTCRSADGASFPTCEVLETEPGAYCPDDSACATFLTCDDHECRVPDGGGCASSDECMGDLVCMLYECTPRSSVGGVCVNESGTGPEDNACAKSLLCGASWTCITPLSLGEGQACNRDFECATSLTCSENICSY